MRTRSPTDSTDPFVLTLWTNDATLARRADAAGVQRIGVDLERFGKAERQRGHTTWISPHTVDDLSALRPQVQRARLFARVNPMHDGSGAEVAAVLAAGAEVLMLPMAVSARDTARFVGLVDGQAQVVLLVESAAAIRNLPALVAVEGVHEIHLGLNDLAISLGLPNRWLALADDLAVRAGICATAAGLRFGLGGIGRVGDASLPIPSDLVYAECARTGAQSAILSRSFGAETDLNLDASIARTFERLAWWRRRGPAELAAAHAVFVRRARETAAW